MVYKHVLICEHEDLACGEAGRGLQGAERNMCKAPRSWWRDKYLYRPKTVLMTTKCKRVHHVYSTVRNGSINWPWSGAMINKVRAWEGQICS